MNPPPQTNQPNTRDDALDDALAADILAAVEQGFAAQTLARAHRRSYGEELQAFVTPGYLDGRVFVLYDHCPCLVYGPRAENIHGIDERVSLSSVKRITGAIALFVANWCGLESVGGPY